MKILLIEDDIATIEVIRLCTQIHCPESEMVSASQGDLTPPLVSSGIRVRPTISILRGSQVIQ